MSYVSITGYSEMAPIAVKSKLSVSDIIMQQSYAAIADAGLELSQIDGICVGMSMGDLSTIWVSSVIEHLGLSVSYLDYVQLGGASAAGMVWRAQSVIKAGMCNNVLCVVADTHRSDSLPLLFQTLSKPSKDFNFPYGIIEPNIQYALAAKRHMHEFDTTKEQLAKVALDQRVNANHNPDALFYDKKLSLEEILQAKKIADPFTLFDIVRPCTGGGAFIVSKDGQHKSKHRPVKLLGAGEASYRDTVVCDKHLTSSAVQYSAKLAFKQAGMTTEKMDFIQPYDCYTLMVLLTLEDAGFCKKGQGGAFVMEHDLTFQGDMPCNTHGGQLSFGQPGIAGGLSHVIEAIRQLMSRAGERQLNNPQFGFVNGNGGDMSEEVSLIFGVDQA